MIYFVGAGPGDPELITLKGYRMLKEADLVVYTGSLIDTKLISEYCKSSASCINSAPLSLEEITGQMISAYKAGEKVVRLHTGDPSLYGAMVEQLQILSEEGIPFEVVPGISSFLAAAASLKREFTVPGGTQSVILTRVEGKTPVPELEKLAFLAKHQASMVIFLSVSMIDKVVKQLLQTYPEDTEAAVVQKATWADEKIIQGNLSEIAQLTKKEDIKSHALVMVGDFLVESGKSRLYDKEFSHEFRKRKD